MSISQQALPWVVARKLGYFALCLPIILAGCNVDVKDTLENFPDLSGYRGIQQDSIEPGTGALVGLVGGEATSASQRTPRPAGEEGQLPAGLPNLSLDALFSGSKGKFNPLLGVASETTQGRLDRSNPKKRGSGFLGIFGAKDEGVPGTAGVPLGVNAYIWQASLDVFEFLPVELNDPVSGVLVTGFGSPPGGSIRYRANVQVRGAALDGGVLRLSMFTELGPVEADLRRKVERAILDRAKELRAIAQGS